MRLKALFSFSISALLVAAHIADDERPSNVLELTPDNFDLHIGKGKPALVEFFAPWCGHCKNLAPIYEQVANAFAHATDKVIIAKVDADGAGRPLGQKYDVTGYPTLKWFSAEGKAEPFEGGRELEDFVSYIEQKASVKSKIPAPLPSDVQILDLHNFEEVVEKSGKNVLVAFTAPWCGHCKQLKPIYEKVATTFKPEKNCIVANVNADDQKNSAVTQKYGIQGFPTLKFFTKGKPEEYEGGRTEGALVKYLNEKCGTKRKVGGGLNEEAGRLSHLDDFAQQFYVAPGVVGQKTVYEIFKALDIDDLEKEGEKKRYLNVMEKVLKDKDGLGYVEREKGRLTKILSKRTSAVEKSDEIQKKVNVLDAFSAVKPSESDQKKEDVKDERRNEAEL